MLMWLKKWMAFCCLCKWTVIIWLLIKVRHISEILHAKKIHWSRCIKHFQTKQLFANSHDKFEHVRSRRGELYNGFLLKRLDFACEISLSSGKRDRTVLAILNRLLHHPCVMSLTTVRYCWTKWRRCDHVTMVLGKLISPTNHHSMVVKQRVQDTHPRSNLSLHFWKLFPENLKPPQSQPDQTHSKRK